MAKPGGMKLLIGLGGPSKDDSDEEMSTSAREDAAQAMIDAIGAKDPAALADAMQTMYDLCRSDAASEGDDEGA